MKFIKDYLERKQYEFLDCANQIITQLVREWNIFIKEDVYLIHERKNYFQELLTTGIKKSIPSWYFFVYFSQRDKLKNYKETLNHYKLDISNYNSHFIKIKKNEYNHLFKKDQLSLDDDQQTAIITDDKHNLIVAGAGSGKTEVLITRIAYLIHRKSDSIKPHRILALAFQNKASNEMQERLKKRYNIDVEIRTFHSLGKKIIEEATKTIGIKTPSMKDECLNDWTYQNYIQKLFENEKTKNRKFQNDIVQYMGCYGDETIKTETDFEHKEEYYVYQRSLTYSALDRRQVKSLAEREILNFFLMHTLNNYEIKISYELPAPWMKYKNKKGEYITPKPDFYFSDFDIYFEHWAIGADGSVPKWFSGKNPTKHYKESMKIKKEKYALNKIYLIETTHADYVKNNFTDIIAEKFLKVLKEKYPEKSFKFEPLPYEELVESVWDSAQFVKQLPLNIARYIVIAKTYRLYPEDINKRLKYERWSRKQLIFSKIANHMYGIYQKDLQKKNNIDFSDMINNAVEYLKNNKDLYCNTYDHILIDEYQDISAQRYEMIKELMFKNSNCKLFCVGDDWQSIMGFAGSNLDYFINFNKYFPNSARTDLTKNYRSIKSIVDVGVQVINYNNSFQINKKTTSYTDSIRKLYVYSSKYKKKLFAQYYKQIAKHCIEAIKYGHDSKKYTFSDFMILLRIAKKSKLRGYLSDYAKTMKIPLSEKVDRPNCVHIMSVHKSKGLQAKVVILLDVTKDLYGFPCELEDADIFFPAIKNNDGLRKQEERRLFYVAITRAKENVLIYTQSDSESEFISEIEDYIKRVDLKN